MKKKLTSEAGHGLVELGAFLLLLALAAVIVLSVV